MTAVVGYVLDDETVVRFEIEPSDDFRPVGTDEIVGRIRDAVAPAVAEKIRVLTQWTVAAAGEVA